MSIAKRLYEQYGPGFGQPWLVISARPQGPQPTTDGAYQICWGCGGAGCDQCRSTGYATMHPRALAALGLDGTEAPTPAEPEPDRGGQLTFGF